MAETCRIVALGGLGEVGKNLTVFDCEGDLVVVDSGLAFPRDEHLGVDLVLPDYSYLRDRAPDVRAVVLTHAHEDHVGGLPYLMREVRIPEVWATRLTLGLVKSKLDEHGLLRSAELREIHPDARYESLKARVPVYGDLTFWEGNQSGFETPRKGENVGREWEYRSYISGPQPAQLPQLAVWEFPGLPAGLAGRDKPVRCEFGFDIYRTYKGEENKGLYGSFTYANWRSWDRDDPTNISRSALNEYRQELKNENLDKVAGGMGANSRTVDCFRS